MKTVDKLVAQSYYTIDFEKLPSNCAAYRTLTLTVGHRPLQYTYAIQLDVRSSLVSIPANLSVQGEAIFA